MTKKKRKKVICRYWCGWYVVFMYIYYTTLDSSIDLRTVCKTRSFHLTTMGFFIANWGSPTPPYGHLWKKHIQLAGLNKSEKCFPGCETSVVVLEIDLGFKTTFSQNIRHFYQTLTKAMINYLLLCQRKSQSNQSKLC